MPIITHDQAISQLQTRQQDITPENQQFDPNPVTEDAAVSQPIGDARDALEPSTSDVLSSAFQQHNLIASAFVRKDNQGLSPFDFSGRKLDPTFDALKDVVGTQYEPFYDKFLLANTDDQVINIKAQIDMELENQRVIDQSGWMGTLSSMAASVLDPTVLIPGTIGAKALTKGAQVLRGMGQGAFLGGTAVGLQEASLQLTQLTREGQQSLVDTAIGAVVGGLLGGIVSKLTPDLSETITKQIKDIDSGTTTPHVSIAPDGTVTARSVGAAERSLDEALVDEGIAGVKPGGVQEQVVKGVSSPFWQFRSPIVRGLTSSVPEVRKATSNFFEHSFVTGNTARGQGVTPAETMIKAGDAEVVNLELFKTNMYAKYVGIKSADGTIGKIGAAAAAKRKGLMSFSQFDEEIGKAVESSVPHRLAEVEQVARQIRKYFSQMAERLQKAEVFDENFDVNLAKKYFPRRWKTEAIVANRKTFVTKLAAHFQKGGADRLTAMQSAEKTADNIIGLGDEALGVSTVARHVSTRGSKFTKKRVLDVDRNEFSEFLVNSSQDIVFPYARKANGVIALKTALKNMGLDTVEDLKDSIRSQYDKLVRDGKLTAAKADKQLRRDLDLIDDDVKILLGEIRQGRNSPSGQALAALRKYQTMVLLGGVTLSSIPDMSMLVYKHGLSRAIADGYGQLLFNRKSFKGATKQLEHFGVAADVMSGKMLRAIADGDLAIGIQKDYLGRFGEEVLNFYGKATGLTYWNAFHKRMAAYVSMSRTLKAVVRGTQSKKEIARLASLGIDKSEWKAMAEQFKRFGDQKGGGYVANFEKWSDADLAKKLALSAVREADATILTPGLGDIPVPIQKSNWLATVFQFKSFSATATNRLLLPAITQPDMNKIMALIMLPALGYLSYSVKEMIKGKDPKTDVNTILSEGVSRSGLLGLVGDYAMALNPYAASSRYASLNAVDTVFGPSVGTVKKVYGNFNDIANGDPEADKMLKLLPYQNLFYIRMLFEKSK